MKFILIKTSNDIEVVEIDETNFLDKCYEYIGCSSIDVCTPRPMSGCLRYVVDDCGKLNHQRFNPVATSFYGWNDFIFGNVILGVVGVNVYGEHDIFGFDDEQCTIVCNILKAIAAQFPF